MVMVVMVVAVVVVMVLFEMLKALTILHGILRTLSSTSRDTALRVTSHMWVAKHDVEEGNRALADKYDVAFSY